MTYYTGKKVVRYRSAIRWIVDHETMNGNLAPYFDSNPIPTDLANMVADLFEIPAMDVVSEIRQVAQKDGKW